MKPLNCCYCNRKGLLLKNHIGKGHPNQYTKYNNLYVFYCSKCNRYQCLLKDDYLVYRNLKSKQRTLE